MEHYVKPNPLWSFDGPVKKKSFSRGNKQHFIFIDNYTLKVRAISVGTKKGIKNRFFCEQKNVSAIAVRKAVVHQAERYWFQKISCFVPTHIRLKPHLDVPKYANKTASCKE